MRHVPGILERWALVKESQHIRSEAASAKHVSNALQPWAYESCRKYLEVALCFRSRTWQRGLAQLIKVTPASPRIQIEQRLQSNGKMQQLTHSSAMLMEHQNIRKVIGASGRITELTLPPSHSNCTDCSALKIHTRTSRWRPSAPVNKMNTKRAGSEWIRIRWQLNLTTHGLQKIPQGAKAHAYMLWRLAKTPQRLNCKLISRERLQALRFSITTLSPHCSIERTATGKQRFEIILL